MATSPLAMHRGAIAVWTGSKMIIWGGCCSNDLEDPRFHDGAAYDPARDSWARIAPAPFVLSPAVATWTGTQMLVWGVTPEGPRGASYDPASDIWNRMADAPVDGYFESYTGVWTGRQWLVWGFGGAANEGAAYEPTSDTWKPLAQFPFDPRIGHQAVWTGSQMVVMGGSAPVLDFPGLADAASYDPATDRWARIAPWPLPPRDAPNAVWTGREVLVWGGRKGAQWFADGAAYDPARNTWRPLAAAPLSARVPGAFLWTGKVLLVLGGIRNTDYFSDGAAYDPVIDRWRPVAPVPFKAAGPASVWSGTEALVWGGLEPPRAPAVEPRFLPVGARIRPGAGD